MSKLRLHGVFLVPHLAVNADVPVLVHHDVVIALVQHTQALQAGRLGGHHVQRLTDTTPTALQRQGCYLDISLCHFIEITNTTTCYGQCLLTFILLHYITDALVSRQHFML